MSDEENNGGDSTDDHDSGKLYVNLLSLQIKRFIFDLDAAQFF